MSEFEIVERVERRKRDGSDQRPFLDALLETAHSGKALKVAVAGKGGWRSRDAYTRVMLKKHRPDLVLRTATIKGYSHAMFWVEPR